MSSERPPQAQLDRERDRIERALVRLANTGEPFTVDQVWSRVRRVESAKWHASWIGRKTQLLCDEGLIEFTGEWQVTKRSEQKSRAARVWQLANVVRRQRDAA
jgi:hypothetical protein